MRTITITSMTAEEGLEGWRVEVWCYRQLIAFVIKLKIKRGKTSARIIPNVSFLNFQILQNYRDNPRIRRFLRNLDFYVLPVLNIDGYIYSWTTVSTVSWSLDEFIY